MVSGNVCWCGNTGVLVNSDKLAEGNRLSANRYFSDEGEAAANFIWRGREIDGFAGYLRASGQDVDSVFKKPDWREPAKGDFSKP